MAKHPKVYSHWARLIESYIWNGDAEGARSAYMMCKGNYCFNWPQECSEPKFKGDTKLIIMTLRKIVDHYPENRWLWYYLSEAYMIEHDNANAINSHVAAVRDLPFVPMLGRALFKASNAGANYKPAIEAYLAAASIDLRIFDDPDECLTLLVNAYLADGNHAALISVL